MKRAQLKAMGLTDEQIDSIMELHGQSTEQLKTELATASTNLTEAQTKLTDANAKIEEFKGMGDIEQIKSEAAKYKTDYEAAVLAGEEKVKQLKYDHALEEALKKHAVKDPSDVLPHLKKETIVLGDDGKFVGLDEQVTPLKEAKSYLFADTKETPKIILGGGNESVLTDAFVQSARKAAQLPESD